MVNASVDRSAHHPDQPDLALWLAESSLALRATTDSSSLVQCVLSAVERIVGDSVTLRRSSAHGMGTSEHSVTTVSVWRDPSTSGTNLELDIPEVPSEIRDAVSTLLSLAEPRLARLVASSGEEIGSAENDAILAILETIESSERRGELIERLGDRCLEVFTCDAVAIVRGNPFLLLRAWVRDPDDHKLADLKVIRRQASPFWKRLIESPSATLGPEEHLDGDLSMYVSGVQITVGESNPLALLLYYERTDSAPALADRGLLNMTGKALRESGHFQAIVNAGEPEYSFLDALSDVTLAAASTHDLERLYEAVRTSLAKVLPSDAMLIAMVPPGEEDGISVYRSERATSYFERTPLSAPFQAAIRHGRPFVVDEIPEHLYAPDYRFGDTATRVRSLAGAPLVANGKTSGLIVVQSYEPHAFRPEHSDLLLDIGRSIAVALERAELVDQLRTRSQRETALRTVTERLSTTFDTAEMLEIVVDEIAPVLGDAFIAAVGIDDATPATTTYIAARGPEDARQYSGIDEDGGIEPSGPLAAALQARVAATMHVEGHLVTAMPLLDEDTCTGAIVVVHKETAPFSEDEKAMLATLGATLASALRNSRLYADRARQESDLLEVQRVSRLVASSLDTDTVLNEIIASLPRLFESEGCSVRIVDGDYLIPLAVHGEFVHSFPPKVPIGTSLAGDIVREKRAIAVNDLHAHPITGEHARSAGIKVRGWAGAPMLDSDGEVIGILSIHSDHPRNWTERDVVLLQTLAGTTTVAIQNAWRFSRTRDVLLASIESLANAVDAKDPTTLNHSRNVSDYARSIASAMGCPDQEVDTIALAGLLHDVGKIGIPDRILQKPDALNSQEWEFMRSHPEIGEQILSGNPHLGPVLALVRHHHERWDGTGYPDGLAGDRIPLGAAIVSLADAIDTMASDRPYRQALPWERVCDVVRQAAGIQFHPEVARSFLSEADAERIVPLRSSTAETTQVLAPQSSYGHSLDARALMIFHGVAREVRALTDLDTFVANITRVLREVMELSEIQVFLVDDYTDEIVYHATPEDRLRSVGTVRRRTGEGVVGWVVQHGLPLSVPDVSADDRFIGSPLSDTRSELAVPLVADGTIIGVINAESSDVAAFSESDERLLTLTAAHLAQTIQVARLHDRFKQLASTDALTGLANHRAFYERLDEEIRHASVTDGMLTVAIMDVDQLKAINDTYGHLTGDAVLREIATVLKERSRRSDFVSRYGGDEFAFILADTDLPGAARAVENVLVELHARTVSVGDRRLALPTGAWGMASYPDDGVRPSELVRVADLRMYGQKRYARASGIPMQE